MNHTHIKTGCMKEIEIIRECRDGTTKIKQAILQSEYQSEQNYI